MAWFKDEEERQKYRQWFLARANAPKHIGGKGSSGGSQFGTDTLRARRNRKAQNQAGIRHQLYTDPAQWGGGDRKAQAKS